MLEGIETDGSRELADCEALAVRVRAALVAAGLVVRVPEVPDPLCHGAGVDVEVDIDEGPGVFVTWLGSPRLQDRARRAYRFAEYEDPTFKFDYAVGQAMLAAMKAILAAAGFGVRDNDDEYRVDSLIVFAALDKPLYWGLYPEETALEAWKKNTPASPGSES